MDLSGTSGRVVLIVLVVCAVCLVTVAIPAVAAAASFGAQPLRSLFVSAESDSTEPVAPPFAPPAPPCPLPPSPPQQQQCPPPLVCPPPSQTDPEPCSLIGVCAESGRRPQTVAVVTFLDLRGYWGADKEKQMHIVEQTLVSKLLYTHLHSYPLFWYDSRNLMDETKSPHWSKIPVLKHHLASHDWLMWMDSDSMFTNFEKKITDILDDNSDLILTKDMGGLNNGVFLIRNSKWSQKYLDKVWNVYPDYRLSTNPEQTAMNAVAGLAEFSGRVKWVPISVFNSYPSYGRGDWADWTKWKEGDLVAHLPNTDNAIRERIFGPWVAQQLKDNPPPGYLIHFAAMTQERRRLAAALEETSRENEELREALRRR